MSKLEEEIRTNYAGRRNAHLYDSYYSRRVDSEKLEAIKKILTGFTLPARPTLLEVGAGHGSNIEYLTQAGFGRSNIFLNELLPERANVARKDYPDTIIFEGDAIEMDFGRRFDCVYQSTVFTSILNSGHRLKLAAKMWDLLNPGGIILWYDFNYNNPRNPNVRKVSIRETPALFPHAGKSKILKVTLAPPNGRRVGKLYPLFNRHFLRSHILAVFQ